jgi:hypothetical protein
MVEDCSRHAECDGFSNDDHNLFIRGIYVLWNLSTLPVHMTCEEAHSSFLADSMCLASLALQTVVVVEVVCRLLLIDGTDDG